MARGGIPKRAMNKKKQERHSRCFFNSQRKKRKRLEKWKKDREYWANNEKYQKRQRERQATLEAKEGYKDNIERGIKEKEETKRKRRERRRYARA